jgi:hypothetical protein
MTAEDEVMLRAMHSLAPAAVSIRTLSHAMKLDHSETCRRLFALRDAHLVEPRYVRPTATTSAHYAYRLAIGGYVALGFVKTCARCPQRIGAKATLCGGCSDEMHAHDVARRKRGMLSATLLGVAMLFVSPTIAQADETATLTNILAAEQLADIASTQAGIHDEKCLTYRDPAYPADPTMTCWAKMQEANPFARPFVHSWTESLLVAGALNFGARYEGRRSPLARTLLEVGAILYPAIIAHNITLLHAGFTVKL